MATVEIRPLERGDDRSHFRCGQPDLDRFFEHYAGQNQFKLRLATTYVALLDGRIQGYATVTAASIEGRSLPDERQRRRMPAYPLPVLRLARLAVDQSLQGHGLGKALLRHVLQLGLDQAQRVGCIGIVADAKPEAIDFYTRYGFRPMSAVRGQLHGKPTPMFLAINTVEQLVE